MPETKPRVLLLGASVQQSFSVAFQNAGFLAAGLDWRYEAADVAPGRLESVIAEMRQDPGIVGANVTVPHKEAVFPLLDMVDANARLIGAVNTISRAGDRLLGSNTDGAGFMAALRELGFDPAKKTAVIVGAGGAARAVVAALKAHAGLLWVVNRSLARAEQLCRDLAVDRGGALARADLDRVIGTASLLVNATPADIGIDRLPAGSTIYFDLRSRRSSSGRLMLLHQGLASFEIWTGRPAPAAAMRAALALAAQGAAA